MAWRIVIAGGGFGGLYAARELERALPPQAARITLVNDVNFMLYTPLLPGAAAGTLEPRHVVVPLREELERTDLLLGQVAGADLEDRWLHVETLEGHPEALRFDHLIVALGSVSRTLPIPGLVEHAIGFKTLAEAIALRNHLIRCLEMAESLEDPAEREKYLTFVFVGGGYAGVEGLAELQDFAADIVELYPRCRLQGTRFLLVEASDRIMREISADLADFTRRELMGRGIEFRLGTTVEEVGADHVRLATGETMPTTTVVWTAGVRPHPAVATLGLPLERGRIKVDSTLRVEGHDNVWAIGDAAAVPDPARKGRAPTPPTAQHALRQGKRVGQNVAATIGNGKVRPFTYKTLGVFVDLGRFQAVASTLGIKWRGFPAWFLARTYHLFAMPGFRRQLRLVTDWTVDLLFPRDASELAQLGHPAPLEDGELEAHSAGGTPAEEEPLPPNLRLTAEHEPVPTEGAGSPRESAAEE
jgi:NADH:quinone reductase (non-electrogenic)